MDHQIDSCDQRRLRRLLVPFLLPLFFLFVLVGTAQAANGHGLTSSFGSEKSIVPDSEPLSAPTGVAWSASTKEIYVIDAGHDRVVRFSSSGTPEGAFEAPAGGFSSPNAIAVDNDPGSLSYGDVYVSDAGHSVVDKFGPEGKYLNQLAGTCPAKDESQAAGVCEPSDVAVTPFGELRGVAVDPSGNLWVESESGPLDEFNDALVNEFVLSESAELGVAPGIAVDAKDDVYVVFGFFHNVLRFAPAPGAGFEPFAGGFKGCGCVTGVAVDPNPLAENVYVDQGASVAEYPPLPQEGEKPAEFGSGALAEGAGLAVTATGTVYVADTKANEILEFQEGPKPNRPQAEKANAVEGVAATLEGELAGGESSDHFAYNTNGTCEGAGTVTTPTVAATGVKTVSVKVTGLLAKTEYTFCLVSEGTYGAEPGAATTFKTTPSVPQVQGTSAAVFGTFAILEGSVNPELELSSCVFQYGTSEAYDQEAKCAPESLGEVGVGVSAAATIEGLLPDTTYDYRVLATNPTGTQPGANATFTTEVVAPTHVETAPATGVTPTTAQLGGEANPGGSSTYYIEYGAPTCSLDGVPNFAWWLCAIKTAEAGPLSGNSTQTVTPIEVTGLSPGTTYRYWIVAHNANGSERGEEAMFTTPTAGVPVAGGSAIPTAAPTVVPAPKPPAVKPPPKRTRSAAQEKAEKLSKALKRCKKTKSKTRRKTCEAQARARYGAKPKSKPKPKSHKRGN